MQTQINDTLLLTLARSGSWFDVVVGEQKFRQTMCEFMLTFTSMEGKDMAQYMSNLNNDYDTVRVPLSGSGKSVTLELPDFARLRSLYIHKMFEIKLEDLLLRHGITTAESVFSLA